jgi:hypothetical protein
MERDGVVRRYLQEHVRVRLGRVSVEDSDLASLGKDWWARPPLELRIAKGKGERLLGE